MLFAVSISLYVLPAGAAEVSSALQVVTLGTSLTLRGEWQDALADKLSACMVRPVTVHLVARAGANSDWGREALKGVIELKPDLVVIEFATNDADWWDGVSRNQARANLVVMIAELRADNSAVQVLLAAMNPVLGWRAWMRAGLQEYYADMADVARVTGVDFVNIAARWSALTPEDLAVKIPDGVHPSPDAGREIIVPALARAIGGDSC